MSKLSSRPHLEFFGKQAKALLKRHRSRDSLAMMRFRTHHPEFQRAADDVIAAAKLVLADAQLVVARESGFSSWPKLKQHIALVRGGAGTLVAEWSEVLNDRDLQRIDALLAEHEHLKYQEFYPREKLPGYHSATYGPLLWAVCIEDLAIARLLLKHGADPDHESQSCCPLLLASRQMSDLLIDHGADVNHYSINGGTPLMWSVGDLRRTRYLIDKGADVNRAKPNSGETPLMLLMGHEDEREAVAVAQLLIRHGADVNASTRSGLDDEPIFNHGNDQNISQGRMTALHLAAEFGRPALVKLLLEHGAERKAKTASRRTVYFGPEDRPFPFEQFPGETPLEWAVRGGHESVIRLLDPHALDDFYWAAAAGLRQRVERLIRDGADVNAHNRQTGKTPLDAAATQGRREVCRLLVAHGAGWTREVMEAVELGLPEVVQAAIKSNPAVKPRLLATPRRLLRVSQRADAPQREACQLILQAAPMMEDDLILAIALRESDSVNRIQAQFPTATAAALAVLPELACHCVWEPKLLDEVLEAGADIEARDAIFHGTPLHWAIKLDQPDSVERLLERGADANALLAIGDALATPLLLVVQQRTNCRLQIVEPLLRHGADPNYRMHNGYTALDILHQRWGHRAEAEYIEAIAALKRYGARTSAELAASR